MKYFTIDKYIDYYNKKKHTSSELIKKYQLPTEESAREFIKNYDLHYIHNPRGVSACESLRLIINRGGGRLEVFSKSVRLETGETFEHV